MGRPSVCLLGASGYTGRLIARAMDVAGTAFRPAGTDAARLRAATEGLSHASEPAVVDLADDAALRSLLAEYGVVVAAAPLHAAGRALVTAAVETGTHAVLVGADRELVVWMRTRWGERTAADGVVLAVGIRADVLPGDLLGALAAGQIGAPTEAHVAYALPGGLRRALAAGARTEAAARLGAPITVVSRGSDVEEPLAASRRLAWFPRPVGPRHAAAVPGAESATLPVHLPSLQTARTYLAMSTPAAELTQMLGNAARWEPFGRLLRHRYAGSATSDPGAEARAATRWACVVEVASENEVGRAWAYGHDPYQLTAAAVALVAERVRDGEVAAGVRVPTTLGPPGELLDAVAARTDLRWGRTRAVRPRS